MGRLKVRVPRLPAIIIVGVRGIRVLRAKPVKDLAEIHLATCWTRLVFGRLVIKRQKGVDGEWAIKGAASSEVNVRAIVCIVGKPVRHLAQLAVKSLESLAREFMGQRFTG